MEYPDEIPPDTLRDKTRRSITHHHPGVSFQPAVSTPALLPWREKPDEPRREVLSLPPPKKAIFSPKQSGDSGSSFWSPYGTAGASIRDGASGSGKGGEPRVQILSPF
ncbi:unnamed protein product, partial [Ascophyllum nodosum]